MSAFLNPTGFRARLIQAGKSGRFLIVSLLPLLDELRKVLLRPRLMRIRQTTVQDVDAFMAAVGMVVLLRLRLPRIWSRREGNGERVVR